MEFSNHEHDAAINQLCELGLALRAGQTILTDTAGKVVDKEIARLLYNIALEHAELDKELRSHLSQSKTTPDHESAKLREVMTAVSQVRLSLDEEGAKLLASVENLENHISHFYQYIMEKVLTVSDNDGPIFQAVKSMFGRHQRKIIDARDAVRALHARRGYAR